MNTAVKKIGYFLFDYTDKINTVEDFKNFNDNKCHNSKYDKCIFSIDLSRVNKKINSLLRKVYKIGDENNMIFYFNKQSVMSVFIDYDVNYDLFLSNLIEDRKENPECKICFQLLEGLIACPQCFFQVCEDCLDKFYYTPRNEKIDAIECPACKFVLTNC